MPPEEDTAKSTDVEPPSAEEFESSSVATDAATKTNVNGATGPTSASAATSSAANVPHRLTPSERDRAVSSLRTLLTYRTVSATAPSDGEYVRCAEHLMSELNSVGCLDRVHVMEESPSDCPVVVARWPGTDPDADELPVLLLNGHYDVVPASLESGWTIPPFEGVLRDGKIYGRGAQDMKCVCVQYVEAIRKLASVGFAPRRHVYVSFVPDEEVGGAGMAAFLDSKLYKSLPGIALALDEGLASETDTFSVFYGERLPWWIEVTARGNTGHGSRFIGSTAVEQLLDLCSKASAFRSGQRDLLHGVGCATHENCSHAIAAKNRAVAAARKKKEDGSPPDPLKLGDVTSLNVTTLQAGVRVGDTYAYNVVPPEAKASLDIRISPHVPPEDVRDMIDTWCRECSQPPHGSLEWGFVHDNGNDDSIGHNVTSTDRTVNPWYGVFADAMGDMGLDFVPEVFPAATDSRFLRALGVRAIGFSPMRNSEILLHENDEYVRETVFLEGVEIMTGLIEALASRGPEVDELARRCGGEEGMIE